MIIVNYQHEPWACYKTKLAPNYPILIPVRHPANLYLVDSKCLSEDVITVFQDSRYQFWEISARNIVAEMKTAISNQREWALRDAIAIAYVPYNRLDYSLRPIGSHLDGGREEAIYGSDLKDILFGKGEGAQFAVTEQGHFVFDLSDYQKEYEFALIVTYGVDKKYLSDTSQGAIGYVHQGVEDDGYFVCEDDGPLFLKKIPGTTYNLTTGELEAQGRWPEPEEIIYGRGFLPDNQWRTGAPPPGCVGWNEE